ncbi:regulator [Clostridiaceae bacterium DONG20-135]|uniref:Regulator n=1 Tax=Copranaerobaculum intestinale TaxID=2692629 RepID=A0A6N8U5L3_9FIRM|nr:LytTR family transcriptional regulator DNA-binding domain-containing protein [Copranaerobaculum intestinale]MXQ73181.1 regulator [Copranaerobaculum intestinale]
MDKKSIEQCLALSKEVMIRHFHGDNEFAVSHMHKNCIWIGSCASEFYQGKDTIAAVLRQEAADLPQVELSAFEYMCVSQDVHDCTVTGRHVGRTRLDSGELYRDMQRVTFVWKKEKDEYRIMHIHVSNPMNNLKEGEVFPHRMGKYAKEYLNMLVSREVEKNGTITVKDQQNRFHIIQISDILYFEAFNMNCILHLKNDDDVFGRITLLEVEKQIQKKNADMFKRVHKSYLVNKYHTAALKRYEITMSNQEQIPVSQKRYNEVRKWLHQ